MGATAIALIMPKSWVIGMFTRQLWPVAGASDRSDVSQLRLQFRQIWPLAAGSSPLP